MPYYNKTASFILLDGGLDDGTGTEAEGRGGGVRAWVDGLTERVYAVRGLRGKINWTRDCDWVREVD